ncbi:MAG: SulP family inorganic anion transporter [Flavobacteriales bacterium]|nr:SulP family inorganic anion transporter [Flavobacteriales bacterium]
MKNPEASARISNALPSARDVLAGFLVSLVALPLCIGISVASGFPPVAGLITAIVGSLVVSFFGATALAIKGPAAGLIAVAWGAVMELGAGHATDGYRYALACVMVSGAFQIVLGIAKAGNWADFVPPSVVRGMLVSIGLIVMLRQIFPMLGVFPNVSGFWQLLFDLPKAFLNMHPIAGVIGLITLGFLFFSSRFKSRLFLFLPPPLLALTGAGIAAGMAHLDNPGEGSFLELSYTTGPQFFVDVPSQFRQALVFPDFSKVFEPVSLKFILLFSLIGSLETLVSARAVDSLDPRHRTSRLNRELLGVGTGNMLAGALGGLPMISEIVRSSVNISSGARTWWSNVFHGIFLLAYLTLLSPFIRKIPLSALGALLVYAGFHLAHPQKIRQSLEIGPEQVLVMGATVLLTLSVDLLAGLAGGVTAKLIFLLARGLQLRHIFKPRVLIKILDDHTHKVEICSALVFSNFLSFKKMLLQLPGQKSLVLDFHACTLIDHSTLKNLWDFKSRYEENGGRCVFLNLEEMTSHCSHPLSMKFKKKYSS